MNKSIATACAVAASSIWSPASAEYSAEVTLGYENLDSNFSGEDLYLGGVTVYTRTLDYLGKTPYDEAPFFNQVGHVDLVYGLATGFGDDLDSYGLAYTHQNAESPHGFTAAYFTTDAIDSFDSYLVGYNYFLKQGFSVGAEVSMADIADDRAWSYGLNSKRMFSLQNDRWLVLDGGFGWSNDGDDGDWTLNALATYYHTARTGLGIGTTTTDRFADYDTVLSATHYVRPNLALNVSYNHSFIKNANDSDGISLGGKFRF
ncbi:hypothetical protein [Pelagicoccus sp. SDUM812003]|uniref:hypothetical protein n=1 Tax=Pelagicoccus sp. SDUM812003 TaxID=3041267 RepID=UPI00280E59F5|nr:hypothetical protein [Pelagicoccus sp. SDUM812003]MDQ8201803.1 hypothetical protein [Pelagicoccus sp. SDUM812003]